MDRDVTAAWFGDTSVNSMGLYVQPGTDPEQVRARLAGRYPALATVATSALVSAATGQWGAKLQSEQEE